MGSIEKEESPTASAPVSIPVIDFANWNDKRTTEERYAIAKQLADACHHVGFVSIINHGVSPELLDEAFGWSKRLFDLEQEEKMLAPHPDGPTVHRGYSWPGLEKVSQVISTDLEVGEKLRQVTDCKVRTSSNSSSEMLILNRRVMKLEAKRMMNNLTSGSLKGSSRVIGNS
jgi:isopenicillin N synthase-like dioxygenase